MADNIFLGPSTSKLITLSSERPQNKTQNKIQNKSHTGRINLISSEKSNTQVWNKKNKSKERANQYDPKCDPNNVAFYKTQATAEKLRDQQSVENVNNPLYSRTGSGVVTEDKFPL